MIAVKVLGVQADSVYLTSTAQTVIRGPRLQQQQAGSY
jgi:hypothetical protein